MRGLPQDALRLSGLERIGFRRLAYTPGHELVLGLIGRFWRIRGDLVRFAPAEFTAFAQPGYAKAIGSFHIDPIDTDRTMLITETRVHCIDPGSRARFRRHWTIIRPFSGLIRRESLRAIRRDAEAARHAEIRRSGSPRGPGEPGGRDVAGITRAAST